MAWNPFKRRYTAQEKKTFTFLKTNHLFAKLTESELMEFLPCLYLRRYSANEAIFFRNDPSQAIYLIKNGVVSLNIDVGDKVEELTKLRKGNTFGDNAFLVNTKRFYNAVCTSEDAQIYVIAQSDIFDIFEEHLKIKVKILEALMYEYNSYNVGLFDAYKKSFGFFDLGLVYNQPSL